MRISHPLDPAPDAQARAQHRLGVLAASVLGRPLAVVLQPAPAPQGCYTDGSTVFLDALDDQARLKVAMQAALLAGGSLDATCLRRLQGRPAATQRYLALEAARVAQALADRLPAAVLQRPDLAPARSASPAESLRLALHDTATPTLPAWLGTLRPGLVLSRNWDADHVAATAAQLKGQFKTVEVEDLDPDDPGEEVAFFKYLSNPLSTGNKLADLLKDILGMGAARGQRPEGGPGGDELPVGSQQTVRRRGLGQLASFMPGLAALQAALAAPGGLRYPEWDGQRQAYLPDWVTVLDADPGGDHAGQLDPGAATVGATALRRQLVGLGLSMQPEHRQPAGDDVATDALLDYAVDLRRGASPDPRLYTQAQQTRRDLGVLILVDASGSTAEPGPTGRPIHAEQMGAALALAAQLQALGDRVGVWAYRSWGRGQVQMLRVRSFDEASLGPGLRRAALVTPEGYTRTGAAIRHAAHLLATQAGTPYKVLLLISDGFAYDQDYEGRHAEADTAKALAELHLRSIAAACISLGSEADAAALRRLFGPTAHLKGEQFRDVLPQLRRLLRTALRQQQRRVLAPEHPAKATA